MTLALQDRRWLLLVLAMEALLLTRLAYPFPDTWDAAEYSWCVKKGYFPHSPYLSYFLLGRVLHLVVAAPVALTLLSAVSGIAALALLHELQLRRTCKATALISVVLLAISQVFLREAGHQEVYALQAAALLWALLAAQAPGMRGALRSGAIFGAAVTVHSASLFAAPAMLWILSARRPCRYLGAWLLAAAITVGSAFFLLVLILPSSSLSNGLAESAVYARGIAPGLRPESWSVSSLALSSLRLSDRLFAICGGGISIPAPRYPTGFTTFHLVLALIGGWATLRRRRQLTGMWLLLPIPYLLYEAVLGASPDIGIYLPLVAPSVCALTADGIGEISGRLSRSTRSLVGAGLALAVTVPGAVAIASAADRVRTDAVAHFSPEVLTSLWIDAHLPKSSVVIAPPGNLNFVGYYSGRLPIVVDHRRAMILRDRGRFTPLNKRSFELLTTEQLVELVDAGRWVVALEDDPFRGVRPDLVDTRRLVWQELATIDLATVAELVPVRRSWRRRLLGGRQRIYRLSILPARRGP